MQDYFGDSFDFNTLDFVSAYDEMPLWSARFGALLFEQLELRPNLTILDLGCGTGFPLLELANAHGPSCRVVGLDTWQEALSRARLKMVEYHVANAALVAGDGSRMPFADAAFDLITSNLGLNNFEDPQAVVSECFRVAKPGARAAFTSNVVGHFGELYEVYRAVLRDLGMADYLQRLEAQEAHRGTPSSVTALLQGGGFRVARVVESAFHWPFLDGTAMFNHYFIKLGFLPGWRGIVDPADEARVFRTLEERLNSLAAEQGGLRMTVPMLYVECEKPAG
jgi:arsenite methyltransferase